MADWSTADAELERDLAAAVAESDHAAPSRASDADLVDAGFAPSARGSVYAADAARARADLFSDDDEANGEPVEEVCTDDESMSEHDSEYEGEYEVELAADEASPRGFKRYLSPPGSPTHAADGAGVVAAPQALEDLPDVLLQPEFTREELLTRMRALIKRAYNVYRTPKEKTFLAGMYAAAEENEALLRRWSDIRFHVLRLCEVPTLEGFCAQICAVLSTSSRVDLRECVGIRNFFVQALSPAMLRKMAETPLGDKLFCHGVYAAGYSSTWNTHGHDAALEVFAALASRPFDGPGEKVALLCGAGRSEFSPSPSMPPRWKLVRVDVYPLSSDTVVSACTKDDFPQGLFDFIAFPNVLFSKHAPEMVLAALSHLALDGTLVITHMLNHARGLSFQLLLRWLRSPRIAGCGPLSCEEDAVRKIMVVKFQLRTRDGLPLKPPPLQEGRGTLSFCLTNRDGTVERVSGVASSKTSRAEKPLCGIYEAAMKAPARGSRAMICLEAMRRERLENEWATEQSAVDCRDLVVYDGGANASGVPPRSSKHRKLGNSSGSQVMHLVLQHHAELNTAAGDVASLQWFTAEAPRALYESLAGPGGEITADHRELITSCAESVMLHRGGRTAAWWANLTMGTCQGGAETCFRGGQACTLARADRTLEAMPAARREVATASAATAGDAVQQALGRPPTALEIARKAYADMKAKK